MRWTVSMTKVQWFAGRALLLVALPAIFMSVSAYCQSPPQDLRARLTRSCSMTGENFSRLASGEIAIIPLKSRDKKEISLCGVVRLKRTSLPTVDELRESLSQKNNRSILAGGPFSEPPTKLDLQGLRLEKNDLDALVQCRPRKCNLLVSDTLLQTLANRSNWQSGDLEDLYAEDLTQFVRSFRTNGINALEFFKGLSVSVPLAEQQLALIDRVPLLTTLDSTLPLYVKEYPNRVLAGAETKLSWSQINFGLKPIVTVTSTTAYSLPIGDGPPIIITHQIYASRYMNGSIAIAAVVPDENGGLYLVFTNTSRSDAIGGLFSGIKRGIVTSDGTERTKNLLAAARTRLETPSDAQSTGPKPIRTEDGTRSPWADWVKATAVVTAIGILVLTIVGARFILRRIHTFQERSG